MIPIYIINLDRNPERLSNITQSLNANNLDFIRYSAIDGYFLKINDINYDSIFSGFDLKFGNAKFNTNQHYVINCNEIKINYYPDDNRKPGWTMNAGELGCYCSHINLWKNIIDNNINYALIMEDDWQPNENFCNHLEDLLLNLPKKWDIIFLELWWWVPHKTFYYLNNNDYIVKVGADNIITSNNSCYLISNSGANKLLHYGQNTNTTIDDIIGIAINDKKINAYKATANFGISSWGEEYESTIGAMGFYE